MGKVPLLSLSLSLMIVRVIGCWPLSCRLPVFLLLLSSFQAEYDIAVKEAQQPSRKLSVKIKQFDISHSHIFHENGQVSYPNQRNKWYYFTIVRPTGFPIKISCQSQEALRPIYEGVVKFLEKERKMDERMEERMRMESGGRGRETFY